MTDKPPDQSPAGATGPAGRGDRGGAIGATGYSPEADTSRQEPPDALESIWESQVKSKHMSIMNIVEVSEDLRKARRPEIGKAFTALGYILLGAATGAAVSGQRLDNKWVMVSGIAGLLCILVGVLMWVNHTERVAAVNQKLNIHLRNIKDQTAIAKMRAIYQETDDDWVARFKGWRKKPKRKKAQP